MSFDLNTDINADRGYFLEMMSGALTYHFGVGVKNNDVEISVKYNDNHLQIETDATTLEGFQTLGDIAEYINSRQES